MEFGGSGVAEAGGAGEVKEIDEAAEAAAEQRYRFAIRIGLIFGLLAGMMWAALCAFVSPKDPQGFGQAYSGLWRALAGALVGWPRSRRQTVSRLVESLPG